MSIVGTRPPLISETNLYEPRHKARLAIKPGITGMWQVSGRSDITDFEEVVRLDKEYFKCSKIRWKLRHLFEKVLIHDAENAEISYYDDFLAQIKLERDYYQVIFCINGAYVPDTFYALLRNNNPHARFIYYA